MLARKLCLICFRGYIFMKHSLSVQMSYNVKSAFINFLGGIFSILLCNLNSYTNILCTILQAVDLGGLLKLTLRKISVQLNNPPFNFMIQTAPLQAIDTQLAYIHWFLQIVPQLAGVGGFEIGTGCYINPVFSEDAAKVMQEVNVPK